VYVTIRNISVKSYRLNVVTGHRQFGGFRKLLSLSFAIKQT